MTAYSDFSVTQGGNVSAGNQNQNMINFRHVINGTDATAAPADSLTSLRTAVDAIVPGVSNINLFDNAIINGDFRIDQYDLENNPISTTSISKYVIDRFKIDTQGNNGSCSLEDFPVGNTDVPFDPKRFLRFSLDVAGANANIFQLIENVETFQSQTIVISFYAKYVTNKPTDLVVIGEQYFGTGGSPSGTVQTTSSAFASGISTSWQRFEISISVPSISGKTLGTNGDDYFGVYIRNSNNETWDIDITGIKCELGSTASTYQPRQYGEELALCQRYYYKAITDIKLFMHVDASGDRQCDFFFPLEMRTTPSITLNGFTNSGLGSLITSGTNAGQTGRQKASIFANYNDVACDVVANGGIIFNAEL